MKKYLTVASLCLTIINCAQTPYFAWVAKFGTTGFSQGMKVTVDAGGNVYTTGFFTQTVDFNPGPGVYTISASQSGSAFVSKLDAAGNFVWAKKMGGTGPSTGMNIAADATGNIFITGSFANTVDFDPGTATYTLAALGSRDVFVWKLDAFGNFVLAKQLGGNSCDNFAYGLAIDAPGNIYTTGSFTGKTDFDPGPGTYTLFSNQLDAVFVSKLDAAGNFIWAKQFGGSGGGSSGSAIAVDVAGSVYTTGSFGGTGDFDPGAGTFTLGSTTLPLNADAFVSKLDAAGNFVWAKRLGGTANDFGGDVAIDANNNVYTTGYFAGSVDFDPGTGSYSLTSAGQSDSYITKLDPAGNFVWTKQFAGDGTDVSSDIAIDLDGSVYTSGFFAGTCDFDPGPGTFNLNSGTVTVICVSKLDASGDFLWAVLFGSRGGNYQGPGLTIDASNIYTTSYFKDSADFDPGAGVVNLTSSVNTAFVHKMGKGVVGIKENTNQTSTTTIYPNPNHGVFKFRHDANIENGQLVLMNTLGQRVYEQKIFQGDDEINAKGLPAGLYNCILLKDNQQINSNRVFIE